MKKLFLASYFAFVADLLLPLLPKKPNELRLAFIPTAADPYSNKPWMYEDRNKLVAMGFIMKDVDIKNKTKEQLTEELQDIDIIFVSGGNTYYLLEYVQKSGFGDVVKKLIEGGVVYIGSSAGSALACPTIEYIEDFDDRSIAHLNSFEGLSLTKKLILPHYGEEKEESKFQDIMKRWKGNGYEVVLLKYSQVVVIDGATEKILSIPS